MTLSRLHHKVTKMLKNSFILTQIFFVHVLQFLFTILPFISPQNKQQIRKIPFGPPNPCTG